MLRRSDPLARPEELIRRVYAYAAYRLGNGPDAEDVTSETFARAVRYRESYDRSKGEPIAWLLGIARHCVDGALARVVEAPVELPELTDDDGFERRTIERLTLTDALATLGERDRELIALRYGADLTAAQVGEKLGLRTNAAEVAIHRALHRLRAVLDPLDEEEGEQPLVRNSAAAPIPVVERMLSPTGEET
jgi:RNA polymerase sigma factor (sigma-70 family)